METLEPYAKKLLNGVGQAVNFLAGEAKQLLSSPYNINQMILKLNRSIGSKLGGNLIVYDGGLDIPLEHPDHPGLFPTQLNFRLSLTSVGNSVS